MELFVINRYEGEEGNKSNDSQNHLAELLKKIEERKKQREQEINNDKESINNNLSTDKNDSENKLSRRGKKSKKKSPKDENESEHLSNENNSNISIEQSNSRINDININDNGEVDNKTNNNGENTKKLKKSEQNFMILGSTSHKKRKKVQRVLPKWLSNPEIISSDLNSGPKLDDFIDILDPQLMNTLRVNGINKLFPVQASLINWMIKCNQQRKLGWWPRDTCVSAPTGSGKTLAYILPIMQHLKSRLIREIRCLVVLPVHELAIQVYNVAVDYSAQMNLRVGLITGATSLEIDQKNLIKKTQRGEFVSRVDIIIATPGRLVDHIEKTEGFSLKYLEFLIIDEADRSTEWMKYIPMPHCGSTQLTIDNINRNSYIPPAQKLLFSATLSQDPERLSRFGLFQPILFTSASMTNKDDDIDLDKEAGEFIGRYTSPSELTERAFECSAEYKPICVANLLVLDEFKNIKSLIFTNSCEAAHRLAILLGSILMGYNIAVDELSAKMTPKQRAGVLKKFVNGEIQVLVSSDALARGLDIAGVKLVMSYDLPKHIKGYIHRAGRTGRAGLNGTAISILTTNQLGAFNRMLVSAHKKSPIIEHIESIESFAETINYQTHLDKLKVTLDNEQIKEVERQKSAKRRKLM
ncbi:hypothetical protein PV327_009555 [Microctonus hyperodae]|uniref:ATP-dependent RNA helicase n=1 Tax=Microctonus hyperodae TaxID=165561 RepID=A0AA39CB99_MICHY|nr:hypothetical protein PV327_009555 [Microctonus hyperodae]